MTTANETSKVKTEKEATYRLVIQQLHKEKDALSKISRRLTKAEHDAQQTRSENEIQLNNLTNDFNQAKQERDQAEERLQETRYKHSQLRQLMGYSTVSLLRP